MVMVRVLRPTPMRTIAAPRRPRDPTAIYGEAWKRMRAAQLREHPLCAMCEAEGRETVAMVADHVVPHRGDAGRFWGGELQSLCKRCHDSGKQRVERRQAGG